MYLATKPPSRSTVAGDAAVVGADQLAQVLGVEAGRERGRADQVDEHHRELPSLGLGRASRPAGGPRPARSPRAAPEVAAPARRAAIAASSRLRWPSEATPRPLRSSARQLGQDVGVDVVVAERLLVLAQAQPAQPSPDVHPRPPDRARSPSRVQSIPSRRGARHGTARAGRLLSPVAGKTVRTAFDGGRLTSDAGVPVLAEIERVALPRHPQSCSRVAAAT